MSRTPNGHHGDWYEIRVQGRLDDRWSTWFDLDPCHTTEGTTVLRGCPVIAVEHVTKTYGHFTAVDDASFVARPSRVTGDDFRMQTNAGRTGPQKEESP